MSSTPQRCLSKVFQEWKHSLFLPVTLVSKRFPLAQQTVAFCYPFSLFPYSHDPRALYGSAYIFNFHEIRQFKPFISILFTLLIPGLTSSPRPHSLQMRSSFLIQRCYPSGWLPQNTTLIRCKNTFPTTPASTTSPKEEAKKMPLFKADDVIVAEVLRNSQYQKQQGARSASASASIPTYRLNEEATAQDRANGDCQRCGKPLKPPPTVNCEFLSVRYCHHLDVSYHLFSYQQFTPLSGVSNALLHWQQFDISYTEV